jgi:hypothetical protein
MKTLTPLLAKKVSFSTRKPEVRIEVIFKVQDQRKVMLALFESHPYEEVAYDIYPLSNALRSSWRRNGWLAPSERLDAADFLHFMMKEKMQAKSN